MTFIFLIYLTITKRYDQQHSSLVIAMINQMVALQSYINYH